MKNPQFALIAFLNLSIGFYIFFKNHHRQINKAFLILFLAATGWVSSLFLLSNLQDYDAVLFFCKLAYACGMLAPAAMLNLVYCFPNKRLPWRILFSIYTPGIFISLLSFTNFIVGGCTIYAWGVKVLPGKLYVLSLIYFVSYLILITHGLIRHYRRTDPHLRTQWHYLIWGLPIPIFYILITNLILPRLGFKNVYALGPWASLEIVLVLGYAIYKFHLFEFEIIFRKIAVTTCTLLLLGGTVYLLTRGARYLFNNLTLDNIIFVIIILYVTLIIYPAFQKKISSLSLKLFPSRDLEMIRLFEETLYLDELFKDLPNYLKKLTRSIIQSLQYKSAAIYLLDETEHTFKCFTQESDDLDAYPDLIDLEHPLIQWMIKHKRHLDIDQFIYEFGHLFLFTQPHPDLKNIYDYFHFQHIKLAYPIYLNYKLIGILFLGLKRNDQHIKLQELALFKTLADQLSIAYLMYLSYKINEQNLATDRLKLVGTMSASLAHEIRNPMASIRSMIELLSSTQRRQEVIETIVQIIPTEIDRITKIVTDLLDFSKPKVFNKSNHNLKFFLDDLLFLMDREIQKHNLTLEKSIEETAEIFADRNELKQVLINLILNACQASAPGGKITVSGGQLENQAWIEIKDSGKGIRKQNLNSIFEPFYTTKTTGTGLGLSTSKRIIDAHGGKILVESEEGKGSTFTLLLPSREETPTA
jgi:signal transduction histidine kinase